MPRPFAYYLKAMQPSISWTQELGGTSKFGMWDYPMVDVTWVPSAFPWGPPVSWSCIPKCHCGLAGCLVEAQPLLVTRVSVCPLLKAVTLIVCKVAFYSFFLKAFNRNAFYVYLLEEVSFFLLFFRYSSWQLAFRLSCLLLILCSNQTASRYGHPSKGFAFMQQTVGIVNGQSSMIHRWCTIRV